MNLQCPNCFEQYEDGLECCPHCGFVPGGHALEALHMDPGTVLQDRYHIGRVLGYGGFGVTYLAFDELLQRKLAIKEYLPSAFSTRSPGFTQVTVFSGEKEKMFQKGMKRFVEEARRLAKFQYEPGIVWVYDSFEENNTAYIVMEYLEGMTLANYLKQEGALEPDIAIGLLTGVMRSLQTIHQEGIIHRDIAPDNIMVTTDGRVKLIDFGAARYAANSRNQGLTTFIKPGYTPEEQYSSKGNQGPHTDVYALAAVLYRMITGITPPDAMERRASLEKNKKDLLEAPSKFVSNIDSNVETAILNALNIRPKDRTATMGAFFDELTSGEPVKRRDGTIQKTDVFQWPLWAKIAVPTGLAAVVTLCVLFFAGVIGPRSGLQTDATIPEGMTRVPSVINENEKDAETRIYAASLIGQIIDKQTDDEIEANMVLYQSISGGRLTEIGNTLGLVISAGPKKEDVPDVTGITEEEAARQLEDLGFLVEYEEEHSATVAGDICAQSIKDAEALYGSVVTIIVSLGLEEVDPSEDAVVPDISGMTYEEAAEVLEEQNLTFAKRESSYNPEVEAGVIMEQDIEAGTVIKQGDTIYVDVSLGEETVKVADVQYKDQEEAEQTLEELGLKVTLQPQDSEIVAKDHVISQDVDAGDRVEPGAEVVLYISNGNDKAKSVDEILQDYEEDLEWQKNNAETGSTDETETADTSDKTDSAEQTQTYDAAGIIDEGMCGDHARWAFYEDGTLVISGNGAMEDYYADGAMFFDEQIPWEEYAEDIKTAVIEDGITGIGTNEFFWCTELTSVSIPESVTSIGDGAFELCMKLASINIPSRLDYMGAGVFWGWTEDQTICFEAYTSEPSDWDQNWDDGCGATIVWGQEGSAAEQETKREETANIVASGTCGENATWTLDEDGLLVIEGSGEMDDYEDEEGSLCEKLIPWDGYRGSANDVYIKKVSIKDGITSIGIGAFFACSRLESIEIPDSVTNIGRSAFTQCFNLETITIPNGVTSIGTATFGGSGLTNIEIPDSVTSIGDGAFYDCRELTSIEIPVSVIDMGVMVFKDWKSSQTIYIKGYTQAPSGWDKQWAFLCDATIVWDQDGSAAKQETETVPVERGTIIASGTCGENATWTLDEDGLLMIEGSGEMGDYCVEDGELVFTDDLGNEYNDLIPWHEYAEDIKTVSIQDGITSIGVCAFGHCSELTSIEIPDSVVNIYAGAFLGCSRLTSIRIPNGVTNINAAVFFDCGGLTSIEIPNGVKSIGEEAFWNCSGLTSIGIPASVTSVGFMAFAYCSGLTNIEIPDSVTSIGGWAFLECSGLTSIEIPSGVTNIGSSTFAGCSGLTNIQIPAGVTSIDSGAFAGCSGLTSIEVPKSMISIGNYAFRDCSGLTSIEIPKSVTSIGEGAFMSCSGLTSMEIPTSVTSIGEDAFWGCRGLTSIEIPDSVIYIGKAAFRYWESSQTIYIKGHTEAPSGWDEEWDYMCYATIVWGQ